MATAVENVDSVDARRKNFLDVGQTKNINGRGYLMNLFNKLFYPWLNVGQTEYSPKIWINYTR